MRHKWEDQPCGLTATFLQTCGKCGMARTLSTDQDGSSTTTYYDAEGDELDYIPDCEGA